MKLNRMFLQSCAALCLLALAGNAGAVTKEEAQKIVDETKVKNCEGIKKYLNAQKKNCGDEAEAASKVTCSAAAFTEVQALNVKCSEKLQAGAKAIGEKAAADKASLEAARKEREAAKASATPKPESTKVAVVPIPALEPIAKDACRALNDDGSVISEGTGDYKACSETVQAAVKTSKCDGSVKKVQYIFQRGTLKPFRYTVKCI